MDETRALEWISDVFAVKGRILSMKDDRMSVAEWDSLGTLLLLSRLQEDHGIIISADHVARIQTVREICELLNGSEAVPKSQ